MGWKRIGNHSYFYRSRRQGGRVVSEYVGRGNLGALCARLDQLDRQERDGRRAEGKAASEAAGQEERAIRRWFGAVEAVAAGAMLAAGFHKHHGQWRRWRVAKAEGTTGPKPPATSGATPPAKMTWGEFHGLVERAAKGDRECLPRLREALKSADYSVWSRWFREAYGNPAEWLKSSLARAAGGAGNPAVTEAAAAKMDQLRKELEGPDPTPMERLLVERAVHCWFIVNVYETLYAQAGNPMTRQAEFERRRIDSAHKRFLSSLATLARVRKLALPAVQVNIGANQVNVAQPGS